MLRVWSVFLCQDVQNSGASHVHCRLVLVLCGDGRVSGLGSSGSSWGVFDLRVVSFWGFHFWVLTGRVISVTTCLVFSLMFDVIDFDVSYFRRFFVGGFGFFANRMFATLTFIFGPACFTVRHMSVGTV